MTSPLLALASAAGAAATIAEGGLSLHVWAYAGFVLLVLAFLALDLGVFHREAHVVSFKEAMGWSVVWITLALAFTGFIYFAYENHWLALGLEVPVLGRAGETTTVDGVTASKQYVTGYLIEKSLAMDNIFVIALVFGYFAIPGKFQHRVLFWGIIGALMMRGALIALGAGLIARFDWIIYIFGGFLILTALKMAVIQTHSDPSKNIAVRIVRRLYPISERLDGQRFFTVVNGVRHATPLLLALAVVEVTDLIFAVDSIPAIFAVTADPFLVFTSNIFAILGLRSLYFALAAMIERFVYLKPALIAILLFVGVKMMLVHTDWKISPTVSLFVVLGLLGLGAVASVVKNRRTQARRSPGAGGDGAPGA